jgi:hypothetical protein
MITKFLRILNLLAGTLCIIVCIASLHILLFIIGVIDITVGLLLLDEVTKNDHSSSNY